MEFLFFSCKRLCTVNFGIRSSGRSMIFAGRRQPSGGTLGYDFIEFSPKTAGNQEKIGRWEESRCPLDPPLISKS